MWTWKQKNDDIIETNSSSDTIATLPHHQRPTGSREQLQVTASTEYNIWPRSMKAYNREEVCNSTGRSRDQLMCESQVHYTGRVRPDPVRWTEMCSQQKTGIEVYDDDEQDYQSRSWDLEAKPVILSNSCFMWYMILLIVLHRCNAIHLWAECVVLNLLG